MSPTSNVVYPGGVAKLQLQSGRNFTVTDVLFAETYGGVFEGAPTPAFMRRRQISFLDRVEGMWGTRATYVATPEMYTVHTSGREPIQRLPGISCAAWVVSAPIRDLGAASELVLIWWQEELDGTPAQLVQRVLGGVDYEQHARDFDY